MGELISWANGSGHSKSAPYTEKPICPDPDTKRIRTKRMTYTRAVSLSGSGQPVISNFCKCWKKFLTVPFRYLRRSLALRNFFQHFAEVCSTSPFPFNVHLLHIILQKDYFSPIRTSSRSGHPQNRVPIRTHPDPDTSRSGQY